MSVGFNPFFGNSVKTAEPWLLADFAETFYGREMRLVMARRGFLFYVCAPRCRPTAASQRSLRVAGVLTPPPPCILHPPPAPPAE